MGKDFTAHLGEMVKRLERDIEVTAACGLHTTTKLLDAARLDLLCNIHAISDLELRGLAEELCAQNAARDGSIVYLAERKRIRDAGST
jgi:hypothetical protein